ncbi:hypothetical protein Q3G72_007434 [Acer saccharum]|nr:hypothetical protein Q3G72_007434 [Acer saccharum]
MTRKQKHSKWKPNPNPNSTRKKMKKRPFHMPCNWQAKAGSAAKRSASEIASHMSSVNAPIMLYRILWLLATHRVVNCSVVVGSENLYVQFQLKDAVLEGGVPFDRVHGTNAFEYPGLDSRGFENLKQLVDVGGGLGVTLKAITTKYPHIKVINFDLPHVIQHASHSPGVLEHVGGDMFESVPESEAIFLKNCYKAIPDDGKVIVVEAVVLEIPEASAAAKTTSQIDVIMMTQNPGGKERTRQEFTSLATVAGFSAIRFDCFACNFCVMELYK